MFNKFSSIPRPDLVDRAITFPKNKIDYKNYFLAVIKEALRIRANTKNKIVRLYLSYIIEHSENCMLEMDKDFPEQKKYTEHFENIEWAIGIVKKS